MAVGRRRRHGRPRARHRRASSRASRSRSTTSCARPASPAAGSTRSATATGARCSPTWASTRRGIAADVILGRDGVDAWRRRTARRRASMFTDPQVVRGRAHRGAGARARGSRCGSVVRHRATCRALRCSATASPAPASWSSTRRGGVVVGRHVHRARGRRAAARGDGRGRRRGAARRLWHAVPSFPTVSEVWLRLLEAYGL